MTEFSSANKLMYKRFVARGTITEQMSLWRLKHSGGKGIEDRG
jgi:hypothetical protein